MDTAEADAVVGTFEWGERVAAMGGPVAVTTRPTPDGTSVHMSLLDEPIRDWAQAKRFFIAMHCSHFYMYRESPKRSDEYHALGIGAHVEQVWRRSEVQRLFAEFPWNEPAAMGPAYSSLTHMIQSDSYYYEPMLALADDIRNALPPSQVHLALSAIIGSNGSPTHGGLIEAACKATLPDLAHRFVATAKMYIEKAEASRVPIPWLRSSLVDVIVALGLGELDAELIRLREKDDIEISQDYQEGARTGNAFCMQMLAKRQAQGMWSQLPQRICK